MAKVAVGEPNPEVHLNFRGQRHYLIYLLLVILFHGFLVVVFSEDFHMHHYWVGVIVASGCIFPTPLSRLLMLKSVMMVIDGIGVWGADAIIGKDHGGMSEGDGDYRLILCVLVTLAFTFALGMNLYQDPRLKAWTGDTKNHVADTE